MANFAMTLSRRDYSWRGFFDGFEEPEQAITVKVSYVNFRPVFDIRYDGDLDTPIANTTVSDAFYGYQRHPVVDI